MKVQLERIEKPAQNWELWRRVLTHTHTFSGRSDHGGAVPPPTSYQRLTQWAANLKIDALGMGSPYTPRNAAAFIKFDGPNSDYYKPGFHQQNAQDGFDVDLMLYEVNKAGAERTLFYLDNETPKGRYGHLWWIGYHADYAAWHDYDRDFDHWMVHEARPEADGCVEPMPYERRPYRQIVAVQRTYGALGCWAHPTSWWRGDNGQFITNIASEMPAHLIADGFIDGLVIMGYQAYRPQYLALWFDLLDRGYRVPGVAEMDCSLSSEELWQRQRALLNIVHSTKSLRYATDVTAAFRSGRITASSGPLLELTVDDVATGAIAKTGKHFTHRVCIAVDAACEQDELSEVELLGRGGKVLWSGQQATPGCIHLLAQGIDQDSYLVAQVRVHSPHQGKDYQRFAITNPVYLHPPGHQFPAPAQTRLNFHCDTHSRWQGGYFQGETAQGEVLVRHRIGHQSLSEYLPASGRFTLIEAGGERATYYLININQRLQEQQRYLYRGGFLQDFPSSAPGEVPVAAWHFPAFEESMQEVNVQF
jgi:hypothetical protein